MKNNAEKRACIDLWSNCLSLIRIVAAVQVMFGHMVWHLDLPINDTLLRVSFFLRGVPIFFGISGFLIWFSIGRSSVGPRRKGAPDLCGRPLGIDPRYRRAYKSLLIRCILYG